MASVEIVQHIIKLLMLLDPHSASPKKEERESVRLAISVSLCEVAHTHIPTHTTHTRNVGAICIYGHNYRLNDTHSPTYSKLTTHTMAVIIYFLEQNK